MLIHYFNREFGLLHLILSPCPISRKSFLLLTACLLYFKNTKPLECVKQSIVFICKFINKHQQMSKDPPQNVYFLSNAKTASFKGKYTNKTMEQIQEIIMHILSNLFPTKSKQHFSLIRLISALSFPLQSYICIR